MVLIEELLSVVIEYIGRPWSQAMLSSSVFAAYGSMAEDDITCKELLRSCNKCQA